MAVNLGEIVASTLSYYEKSLADNIFKRHAMLNHYKNNGGTKKYPGGDRIVVPLMYSANSTVKAFSGQDTLDLAYQDTVDAAYYNYKLYNVAITLTLEDELKNSGPQQVINLLEAKVEQAEMSLAERLNNDMFNGAGSDAKEITGIETLIAASGTVGNVNGTTYTWWRSAVDYSSETLTIADIRAATNSTNHGSGAPRLSIVMTDQTL